MKENNININFTSIVDYIRDKDVEIEYLIDKFNKQKEVLDKIKEKVRYYKSLEYGTYDSYDILSDLSHILYDLGDYINVNNLGGVKFD